jgi:DNA polymerase-3 subunit alpha
MKKYTPLHLHTHYSLLDGLSKPEDVAKRCAKLGVSSCAVTDHGSISGCVKFFQTMKQNKIKPILGVELYISDKDSHVQSKENRKLSHMLLLAKNLKGWKNLIDIVSESNKPENYYYKPRLDIKKLQAKIVVIRDHISLAKFTKTTPLFQTLRL